MEVLNNFMKKLMVVPRRPEFVGFTMPTTNFFDLCLAELNKVAHRDLSRFCHYSTGEEDYQFYFVLDTEEILTEISHVEMQRIELEIGCDFEDYWDVADMLARKAFGIEQWVYATCLEYQGDNVEIHIGLPSV